MSKNTQTKQTLEVDTKHFKGNFPESCLVEGALVPASMGSKELMDAQVGMGGGSYIDAHACGRAALDWVCLVGSSGSVRSKARSRPRLLNPFHQFKHHHHQNLQDKLEWKVLLPRTKLGPDQQHYFEAGKGEVASVGPVSHLKLTMYPDGGISRLRAFGRKAADDGARNRSRL